MNNLLGSRVVAGLEGAGITGNSGALDYEALLEMALRVAQDATLTVRHGAGTRLLLLGNGKVKSSFELHRSPSAQEAVPAGREAGGAGKGGGQPAAKGASALSRSSEALQEGALDFHLAPHGGADIPELASIFPNSAVTALQALPILGPARPVVPVLVDLRELVARAREELFSGAITVRSATEAGIALFHEGRIGAAFFDKGSYVWERSDALRGIYRYSLGAANEPLLLHPLEGDLARSLLGLAVDRRVGGGEPKSFSGINAGEGGYTFYLGGTAYLHVSAPHAAANGRFGMLESVPDLDLPDDPPGWESRRFDLTLRGRDALNPMTELWMEFSDAYGSGGRRVLEAVLRGTTIEETAAQLSMELQALKPWLEKLEKDGLIRERR